MRSEVATLSFWRLWVIEWPQPQPQPLPLPPRERSEQNRTSHLLTDLPDPTLAGDRHVLHRPISLPPPRLCFPSPIPRVRLRGRSQGKTRPPKSLSLCLFHCVVQTWKLALSLTPSRSLCLWFSSLNSDSDLWFVRIVLIWDASFPISVAFHFLLLHVCMFVCL